MEDELLRQTNLFGALETEQLEALLPLTRQLFCPAGTRIFSEAEAGECFYILVWGAVEIRSGQRLIATLTAGETFGESALIGRDHRSADAQAIEDTLLLSMEGGATRTLLHTWPVLGERVWFHLCSALYRRMTQTTALLRG